MLIRFSLDGDLRFISHRDSMRLFQRALVRARVPVRYSEGFNPRVRLQLPLPRPVGVAADNEVLVVETSEPVEPRATLDDLRRQMPAGLSLCDAEILPPGAKPRPVRAEYRLPIPHERQAAVCGAAKRLLDQTRFDVRREATGRGSAKVLDIRPYIHSLEMAGGELTIRVHLTQAGTVRPREVIEALGLPADDLLVRLRRTQVTWDTAGDASEKHDTMPDGTTKRLKEPPIVRGHEPQENHAKTRAQEETQGCQSP